MSKILIERLNLEVNAPAGTKGFPLQEKVLDILNREVFPKLETWMENLEKRAPIRLRLPVLILPEIQLSKGNLEGNLGREILEKFQKQILDLLSKSESEKMETPTSGTQKTDLEDGKPGRENLEIYFHVLKTGTLPWWADRSDWLNLQPEISQILLDDHPAFREKLNAVFLDFPPALERFLEMHPASVSGKFFEKFFGKADWKKMENSFNYFSKTVSISPKKLRVFLLKIGLLSKKGGPIRQDFFQKQIFQLFENQPPGEIYEPKKQLDWVERILKKAGLPVPEPGFKIEEETKLESVSKIPKSEKAGSGFFVENAGLVLLAPYLKTYFENLGCCANGLFLSEELRQKAVLALGFLGTGATHFPEFDLPLNKLLCGLEIENPVSLHLVLTESEIRESEELLLSVIKNWPALKNTGMDGLRQGFLNRKGKLFQHQPGWKLIVERKTHDVLLEKIPWGFSQIKLPWMTSILSVDW